MYEWSQVGGASYDMNVNLFDMWLKVKPCVLFGVIKAKLLWSYISSMVGEIEYPYRHQNAGVWLALL